MVLPYYNICKKLPDVLSFIGFGTADAKVCSTLASKQIRYGTKECNGFETPPLSWVGYTFSTKEVPDQFRLTLTFWVGVEERKAGTCLWFGVETPGDPTTEPITACVQSPRCYVQEVTHTVLAPMVEDLLNQLQEAVSDGSAVDTLLKVGFWVVVLILVAAAAFAISSAIGVLAVVGAVTGGAIVA